jgi:DNA-binding LytR/AlgR family response regulator
MKIWKLAILEDNDELLEDRKRNLESIEHACVVAASNNSTDFLRQVRETKPDAILVDIDLRNDSMNGLDIAYKLNLPVLFVSSDNPRHIKDLENLKLEHDLIVDHITKPFTDKAFIKTVERFIKDIYIRNAAEYKFQESQTRQGYHYDKIVFLSADKMEGSESNNKMIYFNDQPPKKLIDFSFKNMENHGFHPHHFLTIHRSFRVNKRHIKHYDKERFVIIVDAYSSTGKLEEKKLPVSENYRVEVRKYFKTL